MRRMTLWLVTAAMILAGTGCDQSPPPPTEGQAMAKAIEKVATVASADRPQPALAPGQIVPASKATNGPSPNGDGGTEAAPTGQGEGPGDQKDPDPAPAPQEPAVDTALIEKGKALFTEKICITCHKVDPSTPAAAGVALKAPEFMGTFWGEPREVHVGPGGPVTTVEMDEAYFIESVKNPMAKIVKGSMPGMVAMPMSDEEVDALMAYVKSLSE